MKFFDLEMSGCLAGGGARKGGRAAYYTKVVNGVCKNGWYMTPDPATTDCGHNGSYNLVNDHVNCANHAPGDHGTMVDNYE